MDNSASPPTVSVEEFGAGLGFGLGFRIGLGIALVDVGYLDIATA
jgi:hypothetical protein